VSIDSDEDLKGLRRVGRVVARTLSLLRSLLRAGVTTRELDQRADEFLTAQGARSAPRLVYHFPAATCISLNEEAVHGIPGRRAVRASDLVTFDVTAELGGYFADAAITVPVEPTNQRVAAITACAEAAFWKAAAVAQAGAPLSALGRAVETEVHRHGFKVLRDLCGHGIGRSIHEEPSVLNYYDPMDQRLLTRGLVIALEPIVATSTRNSRLSPDGWTVRSADNSLTAHFEHTIVITKRRPLILTAA
jgi:methionyl aminopeptidase